MRKIIYLLFITIAIIAGAVVFLNKTVTTRQCIDYQCRSIRLPLYLKILDFFDRHYNYGHLARLITEGSRTDEERAMRIFEWTYANIKRVPVGLPVIDDHVWHIIVRRYGADDQLQDVFTTLCNYAKIDAFFSALPYENKNMKRYFSFVKLKGAWAVFDAYGGVYFKNTGGRMASLEDLSKGDWQAVILLNNNFMPADDYTGYFKNINSVNLRNWKALRSSIQSPVRRLSFWFWGKG